MTKLSFGKVIAAILLAILAVASGARAQAQPQVSSIPPVQIITSITPLSAVPGTPDFTLTVNGANFVTGNSTVRWNGTSLTTTFVSADQLTAAVPAAQFTSAGTGSITVINTGVKLVPPFNLPAGFTLVSDIVYFQVGSPFTNIADAALSAGVGASPTGIVAADFDHDGKLDLAVTNNTDATVSILLGNGDGTYKAQSTIATLAQPWGIVTGDLNGDGFADLVIGNNGTTGVNIALGNGSGGFTVTTLAGGSCPLYPVPADLNKDGNLDIVVGNECGNGILIFLGNGNGTFGTATTLGGAGVSDIGQIVVGDFDGDGNLDIAATLSQGTQIAVYKGTGTGTFSAATLYTAAAVPWSIVAGDFDGDGKLDLAVGSASGGGVGILLGNGDASFKAPSVIAASGTYLALAAADVNFDGKLDLVTLGGNGALQVFPGLGNGTAGTVQTLGSGNTGYGLVLGNFATSDTLDAAVTSFSTANTYRPSISIAPATFNFPVTAIGASVQASFTITNNTQVVVPIASISLIGTNPGDFSETAPSCAFNPLAPAGTCFVTVTFTPVAAGTRIASLSVADSAPGSPQSSVLLGTGSGTPVAGLSTTALEFGNQTVGVASLSMPVVVTNTGTAAFTSLAVSIIGTNGTEFTQTNNCTATLAVNASCTVHVTFTAGDVGDRTGSMLFTDDAPNSPQLVTLDGTGVSAASQLLYIQAPPTTIMAGSSLGTVTVGVYTMQSVLVTTSTVPIQLTINGPMFHQSSTMNAVAGIATFDLSATPLDQAGVYTITASNGEVVVPRNATRKTRRAALPANNVGLAPAVATTTVTPQNSSLQMNVFGYPSPAFAGIAHTFTVSVTDAFSNPLTTYTGTVTLSSTDQTAVLAPSPYTFVSGDLGAHTFTGTLNTVGTQTISATDGDLSGSQAGIVIQARPHFIVNTLVDDAGTALCDGDEPCSLRSAINQTNTDGAGDITVDDSGFNGGPPFTVSLSMGALELNSNITITGPGEMLFVVNGNDGITVFQVDEGAVATISALTVTHGSSANNGGGISNAGSLTLTNVTVTNSAATLDGGGIYSTGALTVNSSVISGNVAAVDGGGVGSTGTVVFYDSTISGNSATGKGGGIDTSGALSVPQSTFFGNAATDGSAIENESSGVMELLQCTVTGNSATGVSGGTVTNLNSDEGAVTILNSIDAGNSSMGGDCVTCGGQSSFNVFNVAAQTLKLGPLADNGGPTLTNLPQVGSPVIAAGRIAFDQNTGLPQSLANDQRGAGFVRIVNGLVDLGSVEVQAAPAVALILQVSGSSFAGQPLTVTVTALTQGENPALSFTDTIHFTSSDPLAVLPADYTFVSGDAGVHVFTITLKTSGMQTITATDVQQATLTATQTVNVAAAAASSIVAVAGSGQTATPGSTFAIALAAKVTDAFGNLIPAIPVTFTAPTAGASGTFAGDVSTVTIATLSTGIATAPAFTANSTPGQYTVTAGASANPVVTGKSTIRPAETSLTPASFTLTNGVPPSYTVTANPATLTIVQGQSGTTVLTFMPVGGFTGTVSLSCSGLPADADCVLVPTQAVMTGNNQAVTITLTVNTTGANGQLSQLWPTTHRGPGAGGSNAKLPALFGMFLAIAILGWSSTRGKRPRHAMAAFALLVVLGGVGMAACTHTHAPSMAATVPGNYPVNVTASVGTGGTQTAVVMITIVKE